MRREYLARSTMRCSQYFSTQVIHLATGRHIKRVNEPQRAVIGRGEVIRLVDVKGVSGEMVDLCTQVESPPPRFIHSTASNCKHFIHFCPAVI